MRHDEQPVDLLVGRVGEREDDPVRRAFGVLRRHLDAPHDAVRARRGRNLDAVAGWFVKRSNDGAEVDGAGRRLQRNGVERERRGRHEDGGDDEENARESEPARNAPPPERSVAKL